MDLHALGERLIVLHILRRSHAHDFIQQNGLHRGQLPLLEDIIAHPGAAQQDVAARLMITPASVAQSAKRMCRDGLIEKRVDPENARRNSLYATREGMRAAEACRAAFDKLDALTFSGITEEQATSFLALTDRMIANLTDGRPLPYFCPCRKEEQRK